MIFICWNLAWSQSLQEGKEAIYYRRYASAEKFFSNYLRHHPSDAEAVLLLSKTYLLENKITLAYATLKATPGSIAENPFVLVAKGAVCRAYNFSGDSCLHYFNQAIAATKGKDPDILKAAAEMEIISKNGNMQFALELAERALKKSKQEAPLYVIMGSAYRRLMKGGEAFKAYTTATYKDKGLAEAYYHLGEIFLSQENPEMYLKYFTNALDADKNYGPAMYELYSYYLYTKPDAEKAMQYFQSYMAVSDKNIRNEYALTDLLYLTENYEDAIKNAKKLISIEKDSVQPRIYKLAGYSYAESKDTAAALDFMRKYFHFEKDSNLIAKDFEMMALIFKSIPNCEDSTIKYYEHATALSKDSTLLVQYFKELAALAAAKKDFDSQAKWLGLYYSFSKNASNVDLFNWGISAFRSNDYSLADSVFGLYTEKYPEQEFGFYWRARTNAIIDSGMTAGLAIPYYTELIELIDPDSLSTTNKKWIIEAYGYMAAYEANTNENYDKAIEYFDKILEIDPGNENAKKYLSVLEATVKKDETN